MLKVTQQAQEFLAGVLQEQDIQGLHLKLQVTHPGTPSADCQLGFCEAAEIDGDFSATELGAFNVYVHREDAPWVEDAEIDYEINGASGQLNIRAPKLKGQAPDADAPVEDRLAHYIQSHINPMLASHGGFAELMQVRDAYAYIRFGGGCHGCGMAKQTLSSGIEKQLLDAFPEIKGVRDGTDHSTGENPYY